MLDDFAESPRNGAPLMFIGQRLLLPPDSGRLFTLERMGADAAGLALASAPLGGSPPPGPVRPAAGGL